MPFYWICNCSAVACTDADGHVQSRKSIHARTPWSTYTVFLGCTFSHRDDIFSFTTSMNESPLSTAKRKYIKSTYQRKVFAGYGGGSERKKSVLICGNRVKFEVSVCVRACRVIVSFLSLFITVTVVSLFLLYPSFLFVFWLSTENKPTGTQKKIPLNILSRQTATKVTQYLCSRYAHRLPSIRNAVTVAAKKSGPTEKALLCQLTWLTISATRAEYNRGAESTQVLQTGLFEMYPYPRSFREENRRNHGR